MLLKGQSGDIRLILHLRIDELSDFTEYSWAGVRTERREPGERGEPGVLIDVFGLSPATSGDAPDGPR